MERCNRMMCLHASVRAVVAVLARLGVSLAAPAGVALAQIDEGDRAPAITVESVTNAPRGARASWRAFAGKAVVLEFWGTWCPPCVATIPHLNEMAEDLGDEHFAYLSVTYEDEETVEEFLEDHEMHAWVGHDTDRSMVNAYGIRGWPTVFVVYDGEVLHRGHPASLEADQVREMVREAGLDLDRTRRDTDRPSEERRSTLRPSRERSNDDDPSEDEEGIDWESGDQLVQIVIRETELPSGQKVKTSVGNEHTWQGYTTEELFYEVFQMVEGQIRFERGVDLRKRLDIRWVGDDSTRSGLQNAFLAAVGAEAREARMRVMSAVIDTTSSGVEFREVRSRTYDHTVEADGEEMTISGDAVQWQAFTEALRKLTRGGQVLAIEDRTRISPNDAYRIDLTVPMDWDEAAEVLEREAGLVVTFEETRQEGISVRGRQTIRRRR